MALLVALLSAGGLALWVGVPLGWLWLGSRIEGATGSLGLAVVAMFAGALASIALIVGAMARLNRRHMERRVERGLDDLGNVPLEGTMAVSAFVAMAAFGAWFFLFSGSSPVPGGLGF